MACYFENEAFVTRLAYDAAMGALEAQQRTVGGNVGVAYRCVRK
jgi:hypothetical protein